MQGTDRMPNFFVINGATIKEKPVEKGNMIRTIGPVSGKRVVIKFTDYKSKMKK